MGVPFNRIEVVDSQNGAVVSQIPAKGVLDIFLSPLGTQVQAWERQGTCSAAEMGLGTMAAEADHLIACALQSSPQRASRLI